MLITSPQKDYWLWSGGVISHKNILRIRFGTTIIYIKHQHQEIRSISAFIKKKFWLIVTTKFEMKIVEYYYSKIKYKRSLNLSKFHTWSGQHRFHHLKGYFWISVKKMFIIYFWLRFGLAKAYNNHLRSDIRVVCREFH